MTLTHSKSSGLLRFLFRAPIFLCHKKNTDVYYVAAAWREKSDWYLNILKNQRVKIQVGNRKFEAEAGQISKREAEDVLWDYAQRYPVAMRELTAVILGERLSPTYETCVRLAESIPLIALVPAMALPKSLDRIKKQILLGRIASSRKQ